jgi:WD40 repeat protein
MATASTPYLVVGYLPKLLSNTHGVTAPVFSPDGRHVAYAARRDKDTSTVIVDGEPGPVLPSIVAGPVFSPDSQHVAVVISESDAKILVVDGVKTAGSAARGTEIIQALTLAPNNRRGAYIGVIGGSMYEEGYTDRARRRVYVDGTPGPEYNAAFLGGLQFTPDGAHVTYVVGGLSEGPGKVAFVVVDGVEGKRYDNILGRVRVIEGGRAIGYTGQAGRRLFRVTQPLEQTTH